MARHLLEPLARNVAAASDVGEERPDLGGRRRPAEGDQQDGVDRARACPTEGRAHREESSWTISTSAFTCSTGVDGSTPWPRLKMWPGRPDRKSTRLNSSHRCNS